MKTGRDVLQGICLTCGSTAIAVLGAVTAAVLIWVSLV